MPSVEYASQRDIRSSVHDLPLTTYEENFWGTLAMRLEAGRLQWVPAEATSQLVSDIHAPPPNLPEHPLFPDTSQMDQISHDIGNTLSSLQFADEEGFARVLPDLQESNYTAALLMTLAYCFADPETSDQRKQVYAAFANKLAIAHEQTLPADPTAFGALARYEIQTYLDDMLQRPSPVQQQDLASLTRAFLRDNPVFLNKNPTPEGEYLEVRPTPDIQSEQAPVLINPGVWSRILRNLLKDVATHGSDHDGSIPAHIVLSTNANHIQISVTNKGTVPDSVLEAIGHQHYSRQGDTRRHGFGKRSVTHLIDTTLHQAGEQLQTIEAVLHNQWQRVTMMLDGQPYDGLSWTASFPLATAG